MQSGRPVFMHWREEQRSLLSGRISAAKVAAGRSRRFGRSRTMGRDAVAARVRRDPHGRLQVTRAEPIGASDVANPA